MKKNILLISLLYSSFAFSKTDNYLSIGSSISMHPMIQKSGKNFENKLSSDGMFVYNVPSIRFSEITYIRGQYQKMELLYSRDCVDSPVYGIAYSLGNYSKKFYSGFAFGAYFMNEKPWKEKEISRSWISIGNNLGVVPIIGFETNYSLYKGKKMEINWNTYWNPFLINSSLLLSIKF